MSITLLACIDYKTRHCSISVRAAGLPPVCFHLSVLYLHHASRWAAPAARLQICTCHSCRVCSAPCCFTWDQPGMNSDYSVASQCPIVYILSDKQQKQKKCGEKKPLWRAILIMYMLRYGVSDPQRGGFCGWYSNQQSLCYFKIRKEKRRCCFLKDSLPFLNCWFHLTETCCCSCFYCQQWVIFHTLFYWTSNHVQV